MLKHKCPAPECTNETETSRFMCTFHWHLLSDSKRQAVNKTYYAWLKDKRNAAKLAALRKAQQDGIDYLVWLKGNSK